MWIRIDDDKIPLLRYALDSSTVGYGKDFLAYLDTQIQDRKDQSPAYAEAIETDDELEVDPDTVISTNDEGGAWVMAWIYVTDDEAGLNELDELETPE